jgi:nucleotide-binding universal stress UspA family protein
MYKRILIVVDNSSIMDKVTQYVSSLFPDATLFLLSVVNLGPFSGYYTKTVFNEMKALSEETLNRLSLILDQTKSKFQTEVVVGDPVSTILSYAKRKNIDLIALETHAGISTNKIKIGSTTYSLVTNSHIPLFLLGEDLEMTRSPKILHPTTGSKYSEIATIAAGKLADYWDSEVDVLILNEPKEKIEERVRELLNNFHIGYDFSFVSESEINSIMKRSSNSDIIVGSRGSPRPTYRFHNLFKHWSIDETLKLVLAFLPKPFILICD